MKRKRVIACVLAVLLSVSSITLGVGAEEKKEESLAAPSAILMEANTGQVLYEKNADEQRACASITKVMTLLLVMEALDDGRISLTDMVSASEHAASMGGSDIWLKPGESMSVDDLLKATVIASANDAAVALAEYVAGSEEAFLEQMNQRAKELGMTNTVFKNCNGLDEDGHVTTARDVAIMSRELIKHKKIFDYSQTWIDYLRDGQTQLVNTNKLLKSYNGITGLKSGTTGKAGSCITATAERDGVSLIAVVLGCSNTKDRFSSAASLLDQGFANWSVTVPTIPQESLTAIPVENGMMDSVEVEAAVKEGVVIPKGKTEQVTCKVVLEESVMAPIKKGQKVGKVVCSLDEEVLAEYPVTAKSDIEEISFGSVWNLLIRQFLQT